MCKATKIPLLSPRFACVGATLMDLNSEIINYVFSLPLKKFLFFTFDVAMDTENQLCCPTTSDKLFPFHERPCQGKQCLVNITRQIRISNAAHYY